MVIREAVPLGPLTTLELGGPARHFTEVTEEGEVAEALRWAEARGMPVLVLGGGSNLVVGDAGFDGLVVRMATRGSRFESAGGEVRLIAAAGEAWDALVAEAVARGLGGIECLSGIPGLVGATPIQNVGAYGQEVAETIRSVRVLERGTWLTRDLPPEACGFGYRDSAFKREPDRFVVLGVTLGLRPGVPPTLRYRELGDALAGARPSLADARATVLALRARKSMLVIPGDPNRHSAGSFFMNPILETAAADAVAARAGGETAGMPRWPVGDGRVKLSAGWLIERAGFGRGTRRGPVGISSAHALALVHHGGGTTAALLALAQEVAGTVEARFGVTLVPEPTFVGVAWNRAAG